MKIEVAVTPIGRTIMILMGVLVLVLAALATQIIGKSGMIASLETGSDRSIVGESPSHPPLFTQAREGGTSIPAAVSETANRAPQYTPEREGSAPFAGSDRSLTFAQAREQWYGVKVANQPLFTQARERGSGKHIMDTSLFTQAREG